jgi:hypothetical protein
VAALLRVRSADIDRTYLERWIEELDITSQWEAASRLARM